MKLYVLRSSMNKQIFCVRKQTSYLFLKLSCWISNVPSTCPQNMLYFAMAWKPKSSIRKKNKKKWDSDNKYSLYLCWVLMRSYGIRKGNVETPPLFLLIFHSNLTCTQQSVIRVDLDINSVSQGTFALGMHFLILVSFAKG